MQGKRHISKYKQINAFKMILVAFSNLMIERSQTVPAANIYDGSCKYIHTHTPVKASQSLIMYTVNPTN